MSYAITLLESRFVIEPPLAGLQQNELKNHNLGWQASPNGMYLYFPSDASVADVLGNLEKACTMISGFGCAVNGAARWQGEDEHEGTVEVAVGKVTIREEAVPALSVQEEARLLLQLETGTPAEQSEAMDILSYFGVASDAVLQKLAVALQSRDPKIRLGAANAIAALGSAAAPNVEVLIEVLADSEPWVRAAAAEALGAIGPAAEAAVPGLVELQQDPNYGPSGRAREALAKIRPES